eukprot:CAMPEP_0172381732 /NCGR_PEP_ID=MMETSP1060-20121228/71103_1 /TAXON_ID=37318 /ORGANISM="Pseudo-nitzschia pungens, Strain cf. cingulata" /LENGTH=320 /DNA_ID=CAMNT_0013109521 /DNA_START=153 /DNA_END=1115 /DNA_ORIENTATION=-
MTSPAAAKSASKTVYKKRLEGINVNPALYDLWKTAYSTHVQGAKGGSSSNCSSSSSSNDDDDENKNGSAASPIESEAIKTLREAGDPSSKKKKKKNKPVVMPIRVLQSIRILSPSAEQLESLDRALSSPSLLLAFTPPPPEPELTPERQKYLARMGRLRLKVEETKYTKITTNIKDQRQEDDRTTKSMTYAASVGINMIVAPISFGTFMYFFSGGVFDYLFPPGEDDFRRNKNPSGVDVKRVILGVVSGVIMMIIEMVLFVIRSHEFESHTTKKKKKRGVQPFGSYSANSAMTYTDGESRKGTSTEMASGREDPSVKKNK